MSTDEIISRYRVGVDARCLTTPNSRVPAPTHIAIGILHVDRPNTRQTIRAGLSTREMTRRRQQRSSKLEMREQTDSMTTEQYIWCIIHPAHNETQALRLAAYPTLMHSVLWNESIPDGSGSWRL